ncbi:STAS domain-containing protein [Streptomyces sp. NPDC006458]|uniref:STAS domain-containing protein n=1 Tax=Streptomyces sp. NPDC006458 TaxID=3154302 RepID=UPI0033B45A28
MNDLSTTTRQHPNRTVITVTGDMDFATSPALSQAAALILPGCTLLQIDLSGVSFMDAGGLNLLLQLRRHLQAGGGSFTVTGLRNQPTRLFRLTETYDVLTAGPVGNEHPAAGPRPVRRTSAP